MEYKNVLILLSFIFFLLQQSSQLPIRNLQVSDSEDDENVETAEVTTPTTTEATTQTTTEATTQATTEATTQATTEATTQTTTEATTQTTTEATTQTTTEATTQTTTEATTGTTTEATTEATTEETNNGNNTNSTVSKASPKLILVGFGDYQQPNKTMIKFNIFFKRINTNITLISVSFLIKLNYKNRLRHLEEELKNVTCPLNEEESKGDDLQFDCNTSIPEDKEINTVGVDDDSIEFDRKVETLSSSYANGTKDDISTQTGNELSNGIILLDSGVLSKDEKSFNITGTISPPYNGEVIVSLDEDGEGNLKNVTCTVTMNDDNKTGILQCHPNNDVKSHLNGVSGDATGSNQTFLISMAEGEEDLVSISSPIKNTFRRKSSGGLSGGAIAGIVIACAAAIIAVGIAAFVCKNTSKPPIDKTTENSKIGFYANNSGVQFK